MVNRLSNCILCLTRAPRISTLLRSRASLKRRMKVFCDTSLYLAEILTSQNTLRLRFKGKPVHSQERATLHPLTALQYQTIK